MALPKEFRPPRNLCVVIMGIPYGRLGWKEHEAGTRAKPNNHAILRDLYNEYTMDLGFPLGRGFDLRPWRSRGIWVVPTHLVYIKTIENYMLWRWLSKSHDRLVFIFIGEEYEWIFKLVDNRKHLVLNYRHNYRDLKGSIPPIAGSKLYTKAAEYLNASKSIWKLPVKVKG